MNLKLEDLFAKCQMCGGTGKYRSQEDGGSLHITLDGDCNDCGGKGIKLTETGTVLKEFIKTLKDKHFL